MILTDILVSEAYFFGAVFVTAPSLTLTCACSVMILGGHCVDMSSHVQVFGE
jgi:hypothetical protein